MFRNIILAFCAVILTYFTFWHFIPSIQSRQNQYKQQFNSYQLTSSINEPYKFVYGTYIYKDKVVNGQIRIQNNELPTDTWNQAWVYDCSVGSYILTYAKW